jgi:hypothetical protein
MKTPGWSEIDEDQQRRLAEPFERGKKRDDAHVPIPQLRADRDAARGACARPSASCGASSTASVSSP